MTDLAAVIPLRSKQTVDPPELANAEIPEPAGLYCLTVIAFLLHIDINGTCPRCRAPWPCEHLRLAYRLREAF